MSVKSFDSQFPHLAHTEKCQMILSVEGRISTFDLIDSYCQKPECDCSKVSLAIIGQDKNTYATIAYGWKEPSFYRKWGFDKEATKLLKKGFLDPFCKQSKFSDVFLEPFSMMIKDPNFIERLDNRYTMFKKVISADQPPSSEFNNVIPLKARQRG